MVFTFWQSSSVFLGLNEAQTKCLSPGRDRPVWFSLKLLQVLREWPGWPLPSLLKFRFCLKTVFCAPDLLVAEAQGGDFVSLSPQFSVSIRLTLETDWDSLGQECAALVTCQKNGSVFPFSCWSPHAGNTHWGGRGCLGIRSRHWRTGEAWQPVRELGTSSRLTLLLLSQFPLEWRSWLFSCLGDKGLGLYSCFQLILKGGNWPMWSRGEVYFQGFENRWKIGGELSNAFEQNPFYLF